LALDSDVVSAVTQGGEHTFALTEEALKHGAKSLEFHRAYYNNSEMHAYLGSWIYRNQAFMDLVRPALWAGVVVFFTGLLPATYLDRKRSIAQRYGKGPRGGDLTSAANHNPTNRFQAFALVNEKRMLLSRMFRLQKAIIRRSLAMPKRTTTAKATGYAVSGTGNWPRNGACVVAFRRNNSGVSATASIR
jgi:hypothetical protein